MGPRTVSTAEIAYQSANPLIGFAASLSVLGGAGSPCTTTTTTACIVDDTLAQGTKNGYLFVATPHAASGVNTTNTVSAVPVSFNQTGVRGFCANEDAVVRSSVPPVTAQPAQMITDATCGALVVLQ